MVSIQKGLIAGGVSLIIFGSAYGFTVFVSMLVNLSLGALTEGTIAFWAFGAFVFLVTLPVYIVGISRIGAAAKDIGKKANRATLMSIPLGVMASVCFILNIGFTFKFLQYDGDYGMNTGMSVTMIFGWILMAGSTFCSTAYLRDGFHLSRAKKILAWEVSIGIMVGILLLTSIDALFRDFLQGGMFFILIYFGLPIPVCVIGAVQFLSCNKLYKLPERTAPVKVITPSQAQEVRSSQPLLLPFIQYDFSDTLTPEMFAKGFCFNCQAFVSSDLEICPKCNSPLEREDIVRII